MNKIIVATGNKNKIKEIQDILKNNTVLSKNDIGITDEVEETGDTLEENSLIKAKHVYELTGETVIADDSGIFVRALDWKPGVHSSRFAGDISDDEKNNKYIMQLMHDKDDRYAEFRCVITLIEETGSVKQFEGICKGRLLNEPVGENGFGYDPLFAPEGYSDSFGVLSEEIKNKISHRSLALKALSDYLSRGN